MKRVEYEIEEKINEILLDKSTLIWIITEGETDEGLYLRFVDSALTELWFTGSKEEVVRVVQEVNANNSKKSIVGIIDKDYDWVLGTTPIGNFCITDYHDIEIMMYQTSALQTLLFDLGGRKSVPKKSLNAYSIRDEIQHLIQEIGCLRVASVRNGQNWKFKSKDGESPKFKDLFDSTTLAFNGVDNMIRQYNNLNNHQINEAQAKAFFNKEKSSSLPLLDVIHGHDFSKLLALGLKKKWGNANLDIQQLESTLRSAYSYEDFQHTQMYITLQSFETTFGVKFLLP